MSIEHLIEELIDREGGYVDHPADRGGPTRFGITEQVARAYGYIGRMQDLPRTTAADIYRRRFWTGPGFDDVAAFSPVIAEEMFDTGVNMGPAVPGRLLQRALNLLNRGAADYPDIEVDSRVGPMTIDCLRRFIGKRGVTGERVLLRCLDGQQLARYMDIAEKRESQEAFLFGWVANRIGALA